MRDWENKVALITGGTTGIGRETAVLFAKHGAVVVVAGRREKEGAETVQLVNEAGGKGLFVRTDVAREADVQALVQTTVDRFGRLDAAFNNAGIEGMPFKQTTEQTEANFRAVMDINVGGVLWGMKYQIPALLQTGGGAIVNNASIAGTVGFAGMSTYVASKHAVVGLTRSAALECAPHGIRVNSVSPAVIITPMFDRFSAAGSTESVLKRLHPVGRLGQPIEVAEAVLWLCSPAASFVTGQNLCIDGGYTAQ